MFTRSSTLSLFFRIVYRIILLGNYEFAIILVAPRIKVTSITRIDFIKAVILIVDNLNTRNLTLIEFRLVLRHNASGFPFIGAMAIQIALMDIRIDRMLIGSGLGHSR